MRITRTESKLVDIFSQRLAGHLMKKGFVLVKTRPDIKGSGRNVFVFNNTPEIRAAIDNYMIKKGY